MTVVHIFLCVFFFHIMPIRTYAMHDPYDGSNNAQNWHALFDAMRRALRRKALYETCRDCVMLLLTQALPHLLGPGLYLVVTRYGFHFHPSASAIALGLKAHIPEQIIPPIVTLVVMVAWMLDGIGMFVVVYLGHVFYARLLRRSKHPRSKR